MRKCETSFSLDVMKGAPQYISKTNFLAGDQCPKLQWIKIRDRDRMPPIDDQKQAIFNQGHEIGNLAKSLYPEGIEIAEGEFRYRKVIDETNDILPKRLPLFEAGIAYDGGFARVDILAPDKDGAWQIIEVKSGTSVKDVNVLDVAFQKYLCEGAGLKISSCSLMHVNSKYIRTGEINAAELLHIEDITEAADDLQPSIPDMLAGQKEVLSQADTPEIRIGPHCSSPYTCDLLDQCWDFLPERPVTGLYLDRKKLGWDLLNQGVAALSDIPDSVPLNGKQEIQRATNISGEPHVDNDAIRKFLDTLQWPLCYFDLESFMKAIPPFDGTSPYQQLPFQFSVHNQQTPGEGLEHHEFLMEQLSEPRALFMEALQKIVPTTGSIVAYNAPFEKGVLKRCAEAYPEYQSWVDSVLPRFVDLLIPFRNFEFYHPDQNGSASIKAVLPVLTDTSYDGLEIAEGQAAMGAFVRMVSDEITQTERDTIRDNLLKYCALDTKAMVDLVDALSSLTSE